MGKIALCAIAKNENLYIREWVEHYKQLGVSKIFLYDNNEPLGERFNDVIEDYIISGYVEVIDVRGKEKGVWYDESGINIQNKVYIDTYEKLKQTKEYQWLINLDIDEFITLTNGLTLIDTLNQEKFNDYDTILIPSVCYTDNNLLRYQPYPVVFRFTIPNVLYNMTCKSIIRIGKDILNKKTKCLHHGFRLRNGKVCWSNGNALLSFRTDDFYVFNGDPFKCDIYLKHYKIKSLEEFLKRQWKRHWGTDKVTTQHALTLLNIQDMYFTICKRIPEKVRLFNKIRHILKAIRVYYPITRIIDEDTVLKMFELINEQTVKPTSVIVYLPKFLYNNRIPDFFVDCKNKGYIKDVVVQLNVTANKSNSLLKDGNGGYCVFITDDMEYETNFLRDLIIEEAFK